MVCAIRSDGRAQSARENERVCSEAVFVLANGADSDDAAVVGLTRVLDGRRG